MKVTFRQRKSGHIVQDEAHNNLYVNCHQLYFHVEDAEAIIHVQTETRAVFVIV